MQGRITASSLALLVLAVLLLALGLVTEREAWTAARQSAAAAERVETAITKMSPAGNGEADQRHRNAAKALELAGAAEQAGNHELSRLMLLNAVNQEPANFKSLSAYAESMLRGDDVAPAH